MTGHKQASTDPRALTVVILVENLSVPFDRRVWQEACSLRTAGYRFSVVCPRSRQNPAPRETLEGVDIRQHRPVHEARGIGGYAVESMVALRDVTRSLEMDRVEAPLTGVELNRASETDSYRTPGIRTVCHMGATTAPVMAPAVGRNRHHGTVNGERKERTAF